MGTIKESNIEKARRLKPEFDKLNYEDKLKLMTEQFGEYWPSGIKNESGNIIISAYPDLNNKEEIRLYNERIINLNEANKNDLFVDLSFDRLKERFESEIMKIRNSNQHPKNLIKEYIQGQIEIYSQRMSDSTIKRTKDYYKGDWDLSKKVIDNSFLQARAGENYIAFLQSKINRNGYEPKRFDNFFMDTKNGQKVKNLLESNKFTINGIWNFDNINGTKNKTSLVALYHVLKPLFKTTFQNKVTPVVTEFYKEFGIEGLITPRSMTGLPPYQDQKIFENLFKTLLLK